MRLPGRVARRVRYPRGAVGERLQRPVQQAGALLDPAVDRGRRRRRHAAQDVPDPACSVGGQPQHDDHLQPKRQRLRQRQLGQHRESADHSDRRQQLRPATLDREAARRPPPGPLEQGHAPIQSGTISSRHNALIS